MFGVMDLNTGRVTDDETYSLEEYGLESQLDLYLRRYPRIKEVRAVPKEYINFWKSGHKCEQEGCFKDGSVECRIPDTGYPVLPETLNHIEHLCPDHAYENGYCSLCGDFWGGIESFDFNNPSHLCEHCLEQVKDEIGDDDDLNEGEPI